MRWSQSPFSHDPEAWILHRTGLCPSPCSDSGFPRPAQFDFLDWQEILSHREKCQSSPWRLQKHFNLKPHILLPIGLPSVEASQVAHDPGCPCLLSVESLPSWGDEELPRPPPAKLPATESWPPPILLLPSSPFTTSLRAWQPQKQGSSGCVLLSRIHSTLLLTLPVAVRELSQKLEQTHSTGRQAGKKQRMAC